mmetsp:Transcript_16031/g.22487  ORF Transcript_16031/g.22487 Transcript_16031/m.22487 type:complete len:424 (-) Transcript_16031:303-1574(-)
MVSFSRSMLLLSILLVQGSYGIRPTVDCGYSNSYPRQYVAYKLEEGKPISIDGRMDEEAWSEVGYTETFVDISTEIKPRLDTRTKIRWDDEFLYIGAHVTEPEAFANISSTCHCNVGPGSKKDQVVFHDNDFEIFVDADGTTHFYKEFEINAANATWDLCLNKPYLDNGYENSTRVFGVHGFDDMRPWGGHNAGMSATFVADGALNDPSKGSTKYWSVEVALPLAKLAYNTTAAVPPRKDAFWRINFSRVEWAVKVHSVEDPKHAGKKTERYWKEPSCQSCPVPGSPTEDNWVWSRQGVIDMHYPERWGFLQFSNAKVNSTEKIRNKEWTVRSIAAAVYYAEHAYFNGEGNGTFTSDVSLLRKANWSSPVPIPAALEGVCSQLPVIKLTEDKSGFEAHVTSTDNALEATIRNDRYLTVKDLRG